MNAANVRGLLWRFVDYFEAHPRAHAVGALALDSRGEKIHVLSAQATCWCVQGLLLKLTREDAFLNGSAASTALDLMHPAAERRGYRSVKACSDAEGVVGALAMARAALAQLDVSHPEAVAA
jgi:hypothetical protein